MQPETLDYGIGTRQQEYRMRDYAYREREAKRNAGRDRKVDLWAKPFIGWDSEGDNRDRSLFLFGNSIGGRIAHRKISTVEIFDLILDTERANPDAIHVIFGGEYDFNMFLQDLPLRCLLALRDNGRTRWNGFKISHIPRKWFTVSDGTASAQIFDVQLFFATNYVTAITEHDIGTDEERALIVEGKAGRSSFTYEDLAFVEPYWRTELKLLPQLADKLRDSFFRAGMFIKSWHGPGALARNILTNREVQTRMAKSPPEILDAARYAFCGGRFESFKAGLYDGTIWNYDINSAYPYAATLLPDLSTGEWHHYRKVDRESIDSRKFALYHIRYVSRNQEGFGAIREPKPLFRRYADDRVTWPSTVTGWYWSPEAALVKDDSHATFLEAYVFEDSGARPFEFLREYYDIRLRLKAQNDPMQLSFKLGPNSVYGQLAQRAGWKWGHAAPKFHQLEWAGYVTSTCRAMVYTAARFAWNRDSLISIDTDGIYSTCEIPSEFLHNGIGSNLGEWGMDTLDGILYWQSGVFYIPDENNADGWKLKKSRGAPRGQIPARAALDALETLSPLRYHRTEFIGYRLALKTSMDKWRFFIDTPNDEPRKIDFGGSGGSKRFHNKRACRKCKGIGSQQMHDLYPQFAPSGFDAHSVKHNLPWLDNDHERMFNYEDEKSGLIIDHVWLDENPIVGS